MSQNIGNLYQPMNKQAITVYSGFSFPCLLFGVLWYLYKGMFLWALISFIIVMFTGGIAWLFLPFFANKQHYKYLIEQGYLTEDQVSGH